MPKSKLTRGLREQIAVALRRDIVGGRYSPGDQLVERQLAQRFGVSHAPIREALLQLTYEGLLVSQTNRGAQVAPTTPVPIRQLFLPFRQTLEVYALGLSFDDLSDGDLQAWSAILAQLETGCGAQNTALIAEQDFALHESIVQRAGQPDILFCWRTIVARVRLKAPQELADAAYGRRIYADHAQIISKCREHDKEGALRALANSIVVDTSDL